MHSQRDDLVAGCHGRGHGLTDTYIIVANYERSPAETEFDVPGITNVIAEGLFGEGLVEIEDGTLPLSLEAIESRVYRIPGKE
jgi:hypothetical protein